MFGFRIITLFVVFVWFIGFLILKKSIPFEQRSLSRMITLLGILLTFLGFFFEHWIELDFLGYIDPTPELIRDIVPSEIVIAIVKRIGSEWIGSILDIFDTFTSFNGVTIHLIPTLFGWIWLATWTPLIPLSFSILVPAIGLKSPASGFAKVGGWILLATSLLSVLSLLFVLPRLDAAGSESSFQFSLLATILGVKMGNGPWVSIIGMLLLAVGRVIELGDQPVQTDLYFDNDIIPKVDLW